MYLGDQKQSTRVSGGLGHAFSVPLTRICHYVLPALHALFWPIFYDVLTKAQ